MNIFTKKLNKKGFTLAELLIVVAIVAILIAIAIPIYTSAMQDAQAKVNQSNERALKGAATSYILTNWNKPDDGASGPEFSTGALSSSKGTPSVSDPAVGWYAWAFFDKDGTMGTVYVRVDKSGSDKATTGVFAATSESTTAPSKPSSVTTDNYAETTAKSGSVTNPNIIVVHLTGTDIGK